MSRKISFLVVALVAVAFVACKDEKKTTGESKQAAKAAPAKPAAAPAKPAAAPAKPAAAATAKPAAAGETSGSVVGTYVIDKDAVKKQMKDAIAKMPKEKQGMAGMMMKLIDMIEMEVTLKKGGVVSVKETKPSFGKKKAAKPEVKEVAGKWEMTGGKLKISTSERKNISCDVAGDKLICTKGDGKPSPFKMVLKRRS